MFGRVSSPKINISVVSESTTIDVVSLQSSFEMQFTAEVVTKSSLDLGSKQMIIFTNSIIIYLSYFTQTQITNAGNATVHQGNFISSQIVQIQFRDTTVAQMIKIYGIICEVG